MDRFFASLISLKKVLVAKNTMVSLLSVIALLSFSTGSTAENIDPNSPSLEAGAKVFIERCSLCHGKDGMGEGVLPLLVKGYPSTNLVSKLSLTEADIRTAVVLGAERGDLSLFSPPFGDELSWSDLESVVMFTIYLREHYKHANNLALKYVNRLQPSIKRGRTIYKTQCKLCHGKFGEGDGRMARVIKNPPPANLTKSKANDDYLYKIISEGGGALNRSARMPPWGDQLSDVELKSIILYIKSIRN